MNPSADHWIEKLQLTKHPEGGAFSETYRSAIKIETNHFGSDRPVLRNASTCIYFLLQNDEFSAFHRIASDELWHFYTGNPLTIFEIEADTGNLARHRLGSDVDNGEVFQAMVKAGNWFAAKVQDGYSLLGCTVSPGFDFADFELAARTKLIESYPQHHDLIRSLTR